MRYRFTKMQSLGNDFIMLNGIAKDIIITSEIAEHLADRHFGVGCDQILLAYDLADNPKTADKVYGLRIFNSDGSEVGQCGNGARCFVGYLQEQGLLLGNKIKAQTHTSLLELNLNEDGTVTVGMGKPITEPTRVPINIAEEQELYSLKLDNESIEFSAISMGNPHAVIEVGDVDTAAVERLGPLLESHPVFPERANIGFAHYSSKEHVNLRVYERGAGETLGCGSGACAAVVAGIRRGLLERNVTVTLPGGSIQIEWPDDSSQVYLTGSIYKVFEGSIEF